MLLRIENKKLYARYAIYAVLIIITAVLQNTKGLFPEIFGVRAMLLVSAVVCISMHEREVSGIFIGLFAGFLWDAYAGGIFNFNAIMLTTIGFVCGALVGSIMRNNVVTALLLTAGSCLFYNTSYWFKEYIFNFTKSPGDSRAVFNPYSGAWASYLTFYLPACIITVILMPACYFLVRLIRNKTKQN